MATSKTFSGLNENALRYLLPTWMNAWSGVLLRLGFGAIAFWVIGLVRPKLNSPTTMRQRLALMAIGFVLMTGYISMLLLGLTYTTPVVSSIFISTEPVWVFILAVIFSHEKVTPMKVLGICLGLGGALLVILTQHASDVASNPLLGAACCCVSAITYSIYLVVSKRYLRTLSPVTVSKWTFLGGAIGGVLLVGLTSWHAPVLAHGLFSTPMLVLLYVLLFPTVVSYFLVDIGLKTLTATVVSLYGYLILIVATVASYILGQDHFSWSQPIAILMIIASVYLVEIAESKTNNT